MNDVAGARGSAGAKSASAKQGIFARLITFFKEVIIEFKKVQRPTPSELWQMFLTVLSFLVVVMVFVGLLDLAFSQTVFWVFG
ncbi:MAG: preprotein translocase subunit SecE [Actinomycetaceae bacterium]|nr:preprotein translocase subunit SecE [Arcanobacterium sp.]MDD7505138.1 preprotein translocase subunit SecE [Actinomycetaceae bacterium]MDY6143872.1 preprotein translocase subunit SecE [Arcanobacterium sp.]